MTSVVVVGATQGIGHAVATEYARRGASVTITGRDAGRARKVAAEIDGDVTGLALDLSHPADVAEALTPVGPVDRLVVAGMTRDQNTVASFNVVTATELATTKLVGYTAAVSALRERLTADAAVLLFGGLAREFPYPGSTTLTAANAAVAGLVRTLSVELAPVRVNSLHPGAVEDTPFWQGRTEPLDLARKMSLTGRLGTMRDIVDGCLFLLENPLATGIDLNLHGGRH